MRDDFVEVCEVAGDRFAGVFAASDFAGGLSNPSDDARVYANGAVTLNGVPTF